MIGTTDDDLLDEQAAHIARLNTLRIAEKRENERLTAAIDRYRYVYDWWASDSYDRGGEFNARMNWARGEDVAELTPDQLAKIGHRFLESTGRVRAHEQREQSPEGIAQSKVRDGEWPP